MLISTSYAITPEELYTSYPYEKLRLKGSWLPGKNKNMRKELGKILRFFFKLLLIDIIENNITFKLPPGTNSFIEMTPITDEKFIKARQNGAFKDVNYLASNFTGYQIYFRYNTKFGHWKKQIYVNKQYKDRITELTNQGKQYG